MTIGNAPGEPGGMIWINGIGISGITALFDLDDLEFCGHDARVAVATVVAIIASLSIRWSAMEGSNFSGEGKK